VKYRYALPLVVLISQISCKQKAENDLYHSQRERSLSEISTKFKIDPSQSLIYWFGSKPLGSHNGSINFISGEIELKDNKLIQGEVVVDMNTIHSLDIKLESEKKKLESHLKSENFLNVNTFPKAKFTITKVENFPEEDSFSIITGNITIKNITKQIIVRALISSSNEISMITIPKFIIDRTEFNIVSHSKKFFADLKDEMINDEIELSMKIIAQNHH
jgi:polyisoprenoid-binding protein YceI